MKVLGSLIVATLTLGSAQLAAAQEPPNLVGKWKGTALAVGTGANPYRVQENAGANFSKETLDFVFDVVEQHDGRFSGTIQAGKGAEAMIGALRPPGYSEGIILDDDGRYTFAIRDGSTIDLCYDHNYPKSKVVACYSLTRQ